LKAPKFLAKPSELSATYDQFIAALARRIDPSEIEDIRIFENVV